MTQQSRSRYCQQMIDGRFLSYDHLIGGSLESETTGRIEEISGNAKYLAILPGSHHNHSSDQLQFLAILRKNCLPAQVEAISSLVELVAIDHIEQPIISFVMIQHPVDCFLQWTQSNLVEPDAPDDDTTTSNAMAEVKLDTIKEYLEQRESNTCFDRQAAALSKGASCSKENRVVNSDDLQAAKEFVAHSATFVSTSAARVDILIQLQAILGWSGIYATEPCTGQSQNSNDHLTRARLPADLIRDIEAALPLDMELYTFAQNLVVDRSASLGIDAEAKKIYEQRSQQSHLAHRPIPLRQSTTPLSHRSHETDILGVVKDRIDEWTKKSTAEQVELNTTQLDRFIIPYSNLVKHPTPPGNSELRRLIYLHVPKAGGTTLEYIIAKNHRANDILHINNPVLLRNPASAYKRLELMPVIMGHFATNHVLYHLIDSPFVHITMLRDPVDRVLSFYRYWSTDPERAHYERVSQLSLEAFLDQEDLIELRNGQSLRLAGLLQRRDINETLDEDDVLSRAKNVLTSQMTHFGIAEHYDAFLLMCQQLLGWKDIFYQHKNVSNVQDRTMPSDTIINRIRDNNVIDIKLYQYAKEHFNTRFASLGLTNRDVEKFQATNDSLSQLLDSQSFLHSDHQRVVPEDG